MLLWLTTFSGFYSNKFSNNTLKKPSKWLSSNFFPWPLAAAVTVRTTHYCVTIGCNLINKSTGITRTLLWWTQLSWGWREDKTTERTLPAIPKWKFCISTKLGELALVRRASLWEEDPWLVLSKHDEFAKTFRWTVPRVRFKWRSLFPTKK